MSAANSKVLATDSSFIMWYHRRRYSVSEEPKVLTKQQYVSHNSGYERQKVATYFVLISIQIYQICENENQKRMKLSIKKRKYLIRCCKLRS